MVKPETAEQLGLIVNPKSSFPGKVERYSDAIHAAVDCEVVMIETQPPDETDNVRLVEGVLKENSGIKRLGVCGGDGSWNTAGNGVIASGRDDISMFIAPCGNADDTATSLYGKGGLEDPQDLIDLIRHGIPTPLPGIKVEHDGRTRHAFSYWGMGLSGQAAVEMNRRGYRDVKEGRNPAINRLTDAMKVVPFLLPTEGNIYSYNGHGSQREVRELLISSASLFAREFVIDVDSWGEEVVMNEFGPEEFVRGLVSRLAKERYRPELTAMLAGASFLPDAFRSALARRPQTSGIKGQPFSSLSMEMKQDTPVQYDGEPDIALAGSNIDITVAPAAISVLKPRHLQPV